jgi:hypothetical protein
MDINKYLEKRYTISAGKNSMTVMNFFRKELYTLFKDLEFKTGCEVGVLRGKNAHGMFKYIPGLKLYLVDPYADYDGGQRTYGKKNTNSFFEQMMRKMSGRNYELIKMKSQDACKYVPDGSLDYIYIDGNHKYDYVMMDLFNWIPKVRKGGILSGHDFFNQPSRGFGAKSAIINYVTFYGFKPLYVTHRTRTKKYAPSWFFVKE